MAGRPTLRDVHVNRPLSNISIGFQNGMYIAQEVLPVVQVEKKSDVYFSFDKASWYRDRAKPRAPGTRAQRGDYAITTASYLCVSDALAKGIPDEVRENVDDPLRPDVEATEFVSDALLLGLEIRVADLVTASGNWSQAASPATQWDSDTSDPVGDVDTAVNGVVSRIGRLPNIGVISWDIWRNLKQHPDLLDRVKYTKPGAPIELTDIAQWFNLERVLLGTAIKNTAQEEAAESMSYVWGENMWVGYVPPTAALMTPAAGYTLVWGNRTVSRFREDQEKQDVVEAEWYTDELVTASDAGGVVYNTLS